MPPAPPSFAKQSHQQGVERPEKLMGGRPPISRLVAFIYLLVYICVLFVKSRSLFFFRSLAERTRLPTHARSARSNLYVRIRQRTNAPRAAGRCADYGRANAIPTSRPVVRSLLANKQQAFHASRCQRSIVVLASRASGKQRNPRPNDTRDSSTYTLA